MILRLLIFAVIIGAIYLGIRSILRDWKKRFQDLDKQARERDLKERKRPDVLELKRDKDGVYRPGGDQDDKG